MAVIIRHNPTHTELVLLGPGYGAYMATRPGVLLGNSLPREESGELLKIAACDGNGRIFWFDADDVAIVEVDGVAPSKILEDRKQRVAAAHQ
ncbi:MAG: hypothetical protein ABGY41_19960 [Candidatus Poribacteria bacterium]